MGVQLTSESDELRDSQLQNYTVSRTKDMRFEQLPMTDKTRYAV
jgi:hypothetical protein